jgi:hypothetical protein
MLLKIFAGIVEFQVLSEERGIFMQSTIQAVCCHNYWQ